VVAAGILFQSRKGARFIAITEAASRAPPEVGELLLEIDEVLEGLAEQFPDTPETLEVAARVHFRLDMPDEVIRYCQRSLELDPGFGMAYYWLGIITRQKGHHAEAAEHFRKALDLKTNSPGLIVDLSDALVKAGRPEEAIPLLRDDLRAHPTSVASLIVLGEVYAQCKRFQEARTTLEAALRAAPEYTRAYLALATACAQLGDKAKSKEYLERFKALKERDEQQHRESLKGVDRLADMRLDAAQARLAAARVYLLHGEFQAAEEHLLRACQLAPKEWECRQVLSWLYESQDRAGEALKLLEDFEAAAPEDPKVQMCLGSLHGRLGRVDEAVRAYRKAIDLTPGQGFARAALADLFLHAGTPGSLAEAKALAQKAAELEPAGRHFFLLALACRRSGDAAAARKALDRALALEPQNEQFRRARESLRAEDESVELPPLPK